MTVIDVVVVIAFLVACFSIISWENAEAARKAKRARKNFHAGCNGGHLLNVQAERRAARATCERASQAPQMCTETGEAMREPSSIPPTPSSTAAPVEARNKTADAVLAENDRPSNVAVASSAIPESAAARALGNTDTLRVVLDYAGAGEWLFLSTVSAAWCDGCKRIATDDVQSVNIYSPRTVTLEATTTRASAVFASHPRVIWAHECGLDLTNSSPSLQIIAGFYADLRALSAAALQCGLPLSADVVRGAALSGDLVKLKCLSSERHQELPYDVADYAASSGNVNMLRWLQQAEHACVVDIGASTIFAAHNAGKQRVVQYLHCAGCAENAYSKACASATVYADRSRIDWLREEVYTWSLSNLPASALQRATAGLPLSMRSLPELQPSFSRYVGLAQCRNNLLACKRQHEEGCLYQLEAAAAAAAAANVAAFAWLLDHGCPWRDRSVCSSAAAGGSLAILQRVLSDTATRENTELLTSMLIAAAEADKLAAAQWLRQQGAKWPALLANGSTLNTELTWALSDQLNEHNRLNLDLLQQQRTVGLRYVLLY
jgi:hypothetical protein